MAHKNSLMTGLGADRARRMARAWSDRRGKLKTNLIAHGLDPISAERNATELEDLLEWVERVVEDVRSLSNEGVDVLPPMVKLSADFAYLEDQVPRFRRAVTATRRSLGIPPVVVTKVGRGRIRKIA